MTARPRLMAAGLVAAALFSVLQFLPSERPLAGAAEPHADNNPAENQQARHFAEKVAPLLAQHCLECHRTASKKGALDLSRKSSAFAGGESGEAIIPGKADESLLWMYVEADEMPRDRPPLNREEKQLLRQWIDDGAVWSGGVIDREAFTPEPSALDSPVKRLTVPEYVETVRRAVGVNIEQEAVKLLPPDLRADGFSNTAYNLNVDLSHVEAYAKLAEIIVGRMNIVAFLAEHVPAKDLEAARKAWNREKGNRVGDSMDAVVAAVGKWLLRGPLQKHEIDAVLAVAKAVADEGGDFDEGLRYLVEAMLQSPRFLYRIETRQSGGDSQQLNDYELASRLSYILWGGPPDKELMRAADAGELSDRRRVEAQVDRMLRDPRAVARSLQFVHEWMDLGRLAHLRPNAERFPTWSPELAADMREETLAFFKHVAWEQKRPLADLMNTQVTFATPRLAAHYNLESGGKETPSPLRQKRVTDGLEALYTFDEGRGDVVYDKSGVGKPIDLKIEDNSVVKWGDGQLELTGSTLIATDGPPKRLIDAIKKSKSITLEAWITPAEVKQSGPARIITLSSGTGARNFTLGQEGDKYDVRLRTTRADSNGLPSFRSRSGVIETRPTHVVYTRHSSGRIKLYVDGKDVGGDDVGGDFSNWDGKFRLAIGNETTKDRPWRGVFHRVAIYSRALTAEEIRSADDEPKRYDLASVPSRGGLLTHGSVLTIGGDEASTVTRGLFVLKHLLYGRVEDPPPCVDTTPVPPKPGESQREIAMQRIENEACSGCHGRFEPFAFGLGKFNGIGAYREVDEHGNELRDDGEVVFPGRDKPLPFASSAELLDLLAKSERVKKGITRKVAQFALGRPLVESDEPILIEIHESAQKGDGTYASLIKTIVLSDLVQKANPLQTGRVAKTE